MSAWAFEESVQRRVAMSAALARRPIVLSGPSTQRPAVMPGLRSDIGSGPISHAIFWPMSRKSDGAFSVSRNATKALIGES